MSKGKKSKRQPAQSRAASTSPRRFWQPKAESAYKRIKNNVQSLCGIKQALQYVENARKRRLTLMGYFEHYYSERGAVWARRMTNAIYAQIVYQNYQISRRSIQFPPRPLTDILGAMRHGEDIPRGEPVSALDDQCIFIDCSELDFEGMMGDGIFLSVFNRYDAIYCCIHEYQYYCGEISTEVAADPFSRPRKDLERRNPQLLTLVYYAWIFHGLLTGSIQLPHPEELVITQDLSEITDHTPIRTIMNFEGYDTLMCESTVNLNMLIKTLRWGHANMADQLSSMGLRGDDNFLMVKRAKLFFALQAWAESRQTYEVDLRGYLNAPADPEKLPWDVFDPQYFPFSAFYVSLVGYGKEPYRYGVLIARSDVLSRISGSPLPEVFLFYDGLVFNEYPTLELFQRLDTRTVTCEMENPEESPPPPGEETTLIPHQFLIAAALAVASVTQTSAEQFILRRFRERRESNPVEPAPVSHDRNWFLTPRYVYAEQKQTLKVPLDQLIPPDERPVKEIKNKGTHASPAEHRVRRHPSIYWCGPGGKRPEVRWIEEYTRGVKPTGVTIPAEVIHRITP